MFYLVEEEDKLIQLGRLVKLGCYIDIIPTNDYYHPKLSSTVAVYIRILGSENGYLIPINHSEGLNVAKDRVYSILKQSGKLYTLDKKKLLYYFNIQSATDLSLLYSMTTFERLEYSKDNSTVNWYYSKYSDKQDLNSIIPITKLYERCENTFNSIEKYLDLEIPSGFEFYNQTATNVFYLLEQNGVGIEKNQFIELFTPKNPIYNIKGDRTYTSYNLYNSTSRPTSNFNSVNFAAIPKTEEHRTSFKPQNDFFVEFDFDGYHLRLLAEQINYPLTEESAHKQLAKHYFGTEDITEEQYIQAKQINFQAIYGKIPEEHKELKIFREIQKYIDAMWSSFNESGYVCNTQSGKHFSKELKEMHPAKLMNYMMQSLETSNNILILKEVLRYLQDKKTFIALYTYDSVVIDLSLGDGKQVPNSILKIMEGGGKFPVKWKAGKDLFL